VNENYKEQLYALSKKAAWNMWVNDPKKAVIKRAELEKEAKLILGEKREGELTELLNRFAMVRHSEGRAETEFIHRTIYEYFAALTIFDTIRDYLKDETAIPDTVTAELAELMSVRVLSPDIEGHLKKLVENSERADKCKGAWRDWFGQRLQIGMQPVETNVGGLTWIDQEKRCFQNYIKLLRPILGRNTENKYCKLWRDNDSDAVDFMSRYIRYAVPQNSRMDLSFLDLSGAVLRGASLRVANLLGANLLGANLRGADLRGADLRGADLRGAVLSGANLNHADLCDANLSDADLCFAYLDGTYLDVADLRGANLRGAYFRDTDLRGKQMENAIILKSALKDVRYDLEEMKKAILLNNDLTPVHPLTDEQKAVLRYHRIPVREK